jgi:PAS domain-containing protein
MDALSPPQPETGSEDSEPDTVTADPFAPLATAYAHLPDAAVVWSPEGEIVLWNKAAEDLLGYTFDRFKAKTKLQLLGTDAGKV